MIAVHELIGAMRSAGLNPPDVLKAGINRFPGQGKRGSNRAGWCLLFADLQGATFGDYSTGLHEVWQASHKRRLSHEEKTARTELIRQAQRQREAELKARYAEAAERAQSHWAKVSPAPDDYPYLQRKRIKPHGARFDGRSLVIPLLNADGALCSLQYIDTGGGKLFMWGGPIKGGRFTIGTLTSAETILICEGFATGATLHQETGNPVVVAFNAGNLAAVAQSVRKAHPLADLIICGDDDRRTIGNPGRTKANEAALLVGARVAFPEWPDDAPDTLTDFNDLVCWQANQREVV